MLPIERRVALVLRRAVALVLLIAATGPTADAAQKASTPSPGLQIVVIEGEDAVNVIQQKTAVAPIVEVRDRNHQPISGATVRFAIQGGRATFNGARTLTLTTNAAGRAAVTGLTPTGSGAFQISATATFQGQTAAVSIAQTNVLTAAQAAGAGGAGGGVSGTTIGILVGAAGAVAGGAIVAKEVLADGGVAIYEGDFRIDSIQTVQQVQANGVINLTCTFTSADGIGFGAQSFSGTLTNGVIRGTWTLGPSGYKGTFGGGALSPPGSVTVTLTK
jgi:hypothetical protein